MKTLGWVTVSFTYLLMVWGNIVSSTGSGLACPDWPLCHGTVSPPLSTPVVLEWGHRCLAFIATIFILVTLYRVLSSPDKMGPALKRSGRTLAALLGFQILLGGTTVLLGLSIAVSTIHLVIALLVFSGLITVACVATWENPVVSQTSPEVLKLSKITLGALLVQLTVGAIVRHSHSGLACPNFPGCLDGFFPIPFTFETAITFFHRWWGIALLYLFLRLSLATAKAAPQLAKVSRKTMSLGLAQILLGVGTVLSGLHVHSRAVHAAVGYLLWGMVFYIVLRSGGIRWLWQSKSFPASHKAWVN